VTPVLCTPCLVHFWGRMIPPCFLVPEGHKSWMCCKCHLYTTDATSILDSGTVLVTSRQEYDDIMAAARVLDS